MHESEYDWAERDKAAWQNREALADSSCTTRMNFRRTPSLIAAVTLLLAVPGHTQELASPTASTLDNVPTGPGAAAPVLNGPRLRTPAGGALPSGSGEAPATGPQLMPEPAPNSSFDKPEAGAAVPVEPPKTEKEKKIGTSKTEVFSRDVQDRIKMRQVQTRALADPAVMAAWDQAVTSRTFLEKRAALKQYYTLLYARMAKIDSSLKKLIDIRATAAQSRLTQKFVATDNVSPSDRSTSASVFAD